MVAPLNNAQEAKMRRFTRIAQKLSLRTIKGNRVAKLQVAEIKGLVSL